MVPNIIYRKFSKKNGNWNIGLGAQAILKEVKIYKFSVCFCNRYYFIWSERLYLTLGPRKVYSKGPNLGWRRK